MYAKALTVLADVREAYCAGDHQSAETMVNECLTNCRNIKDADKRQQIESHASQMVDGARTNLALTVLSEGRELYGAGHHQSAITKVDECLAICSTIKDADKREQIESHANQTGDAARTNLAAEVLDAGNDLNRKGEVGFARSKYEEALAIGLAIADANTRKKVLGPAHGSLGSACRQARQFDQAIAHHEAALAIAREVGNRWLEGKELVNLGNVYNEMGQYEKGATSHAAARAIHKKFGKLKQPDAAAAAAPTDHAPHEGESGEACGLRLFSQQPTREQNFCTIEGIFCGAVSDAWCGFKDRGYCGDADDGLGECACPVDMPNWEFDYSEPPSATPGATH